MKAVVAVRGKIPSEDGKSSTAEIELWKNSIIYLGAFSTINQSESEKF
jgi:hypothetical protein